jgi:hypothetical protein
VDTTAAAIPFHEGKGGSDGFTIAPDESQTRCQSKEGNDPQKIAEKSGESATRCEEGKLLMCEPAQ